MDDPSSSVFKLKKIGDFCRKKKSILNLSFYTYSLKKEKKRNVRCLGHENLFVINII